MRKTLLIFVFALLAAACGGAGSSDSTPAPADTSEAAPVEVGSTPAGSENASGTDDTAAPGDSDDTVAAEDAEAAAPPSFDGPPAPDFELALADGSTFSLADEKKPVYMVFWAEW